MIIITEICVLHLYFVFVYHVCASKIQLERINNSQKKACFRRYKQAFNYLGKYEFQQLTLFEQLHFFNLLEVS